MQNKIQNSLFPCGLAALALAEIRTRCQWNLVTVKSDRFGSRKLRDPFINVCKMAFSTGG
jgi:hypothetical protein